MDTNISPFHKRTTMPVLTSNSITRPKSSVVTANLPLGAKVMVLPWRRKSGRPYLKRSGRKSETKQWWQEIKRNCCQETNTGTCTRSFGSHNTHNVLIPRDHDLVSPNLSQRKHMDVLRTYSCSSKEDIIIQVHITWLKEGFLSPLLVLLV